MSAHKNNRSSALLEASRILRDLKVGDTVIVDIDGKLSTMTVQRELSRPDGYGTWDHEAVVKIGFGLGRYNTEVSASRIADGFISIDKLTD